MRNERDLIPVRLPSGRKALVNLPRPFTASDAAHLANFLAEYVEAPEPEPPAQIQFFTHLE